MNRNKTIYKYLLLFIISLLLLVLTGCNKSELEEQSKSLNQYDITLSLHAPSKTLSGNMIFTYTNNSDCTINALKFQLYANAYRETAKYKAVNNDSIAETYPNGLSYGHIDIKSVKTEGEAVEFDICGEDQNILSVSLKNDLFRGDRITTEITYEITIPNAKHRLGWFDGTFNLANAYPILCYCENGIFTEYPYYDYGDPFASEMSNYNVVFIAPKEYVVTSSGELIYQREDENTITYGFSQKCIRDFAICASAQFNVKSYTCNGTVINYYYLSDTETDATVSLTAQCIDYFSKSFGEYPYKTYNVVQTHLSSAGGMEYPKLVYISNDLDRDSQNRVIIHETSHQWWYGIVGNDQVRHAWLDEALAEYSTLSFYKNYSQYGNAQEMIKNSYTRYKLYYDVIKDYKKDYDTSLDRSLPDFKNNNTYVCMVYLKGLLMLDSLETTMGTKKLTNALRRYYNNAKYSMATPEILLKCCEKEYGSDMKKWFASWLGSDTVIG